MIKSFWIRNVSVRAGGEGLTHLASPHSVPHPHTPKVTGNVQGAEPENRRARLQAPQPPSVPRTVGVPGCRTSHDKPGQFWEDQCELAPLPGGGSEPFSEGSLQSEQLRLSHPFLLYFSLAGYP